MSEKLSDIKGGEVRGKFASRRDEALYVMSMESWATESNGDNQSPTGWFAWMSNSQVEIPEITSVFREPFAEIAVDPAALVGNFLVRETDQGFVEVTTYDSEDDVRAEYQKLEQEFEHFLAEVGDE